MKIYILTENALELGECLAMQARARRVKLKKKVKLQLVKQVPVAKNTLSGYDSTQKGYSFFGLLRKVLLGFRFSRTKIKTKSDTILLGK